VGGLANPVKKTTRPTWAQAENVKIGKVGGVKKNEPVGSTPFKGDRWVGGENVAGDGAPEGEKTPPANP